MTPPPTEPKEDLAYVESFSAWLDQNNDTLPEPDSFSAWLNQNDDSIETESSYEH